MPAQTASLMLDLAFNDAEFQKIAMGCIPEVMEDKWFIFFEDPWLHLHRSWTGYCIYRVRFAQEDGKHRPIDVVVNRDPAQYRETNDALDALSLTIQLFGLAGRRDEALWRKYRLVEHDSRPPKVVPPPRPMRFIPPLPPAPGQGEPVAERLLDPSRRIRRRWGPAMRPPSFLMRLTYLVIAIMVVWLIHSIVTALRH